MIFVECSFRDLAVGDVIRDKTHQHQYRVLELPKEDKDKDIYRMKVALQQGATEGPTEELVFSANFRPLLVTTERDVAARVLDGLQGFTPEVRRTVYKYIKDHACTVCYDLVCFDHIARSS